MIRKTINYKDKVPVTDGVWLYYHAGYLNDVTGTDVNSLNDISGNGRDAFPAVGQSDLGELVTIDGLPYIRGFGDVVYRLANITKTFNEMTIVSNCIFDSIETSTIIRQVGGSNEFNFNWIRFTNIFYNRIGSGAYQTYLSGNPSVGEKFVNTLRYTGSVVETYKNGVVQDSDSQSLDPTLSGDELYFLAMNISGGGAQTFKGKVSEIIIYDRSLTNSELSEVHTYFNEKYGPNSPVINYSEPKKFQYLPPTDLSSHKDNGLVLAINKNSIQGKEVIDLSGNGNNGTNNGVQPSKDGMRFDGIDDYMYNQSATLDSIWTVSVWVYADTLSTGRYSFFSQYVSSTGRTFFAINNSKIEFFNSSSNLGTTTINTDTWYHLVFDSTGKVYINANSTPEIDIGSTDPVEQTQNVIGARQNIGGGTTNIEHFDGIIDDIRIYNRVLTTDEITKIYNQFAKQTTFKETFEDYAVGETSFKHWQKGTGSYEIEETDATETQLNVGTKVLKCTSDGTIVTQQTQAYGSWEFRGIERNSNLIQLSLTAQLQDSSITNLGYYLYLSNAQIRFRKPSVLFELTSPILLEVKYDFLIQRLSSPGKFPLIGDDVEYPVNTFAVFYRETTPNNKNPWELVPVTSGSNPVTDSTYTTSKYMVLDMYADDSISEIIIKEGVEQ